MTAAAYFDLKNKIFHNRKAEPTPILTGTLTGWSTSYMVSITEFAKMCSKLELEARNDQKRNPIARSKYYRKGTQEQMNTSDFME